MPRHTTVDGHDHRVVELVGAAGVGDPFTVRGPRVGTAPAGTPRERSVLTRFHVDDAQFLARAVVRQVSAVGREPGIVVTAWTVGELALLLSREIVREKLRGAVPPRDVRDLVGVARPGNVALGRRRVGHPRRRSVALHGSGENLPARNERELLLVGGHREAAEPVGHVLDLGPRTLDRAHEVDVELGGPARRRVVCPDAEVPLEGNQRPVDRDGRPEHPALSEVREPLLAAHTGGVSGNGPQILGPTPVRHEVDAFSGVIPHRPGVLPARSERRVRRRGALAHKPNLGLVDVGVAVPPPLAPRHVATCADGDDALIRSRSREELGLVLVRGDGERRPTRGSDSVDVAHARDVLVRRREVDPLRVARPSIELLRARGVGEARDTSVAQVYHVDVEASVPVGVEGDARCVRGVERPRFIARVRHQKSRRTALRGHRPDVSTRDESDLGAVRRDSGLGEGGKSLDVGLRGQSRGWRRQNGGA